jgi:Mg-chelatase subunit ChlI
MWKYFLGVPILIGVPTGFIGYRRRQDYLNDPVLKRAMMHIRNDQRIIDFCGEEVRPGWIIQKKTSPNDNWVKYDLNVKGLSGKLKTTVIGDYLQHAELMILEREREDYFKQKEVLAKAAAEAAAKEAAEAAEAAKKKGKQPLPKKGAEPIVPAKPTALEAVAA